MPWECLPPALGPLLCAVNASWSEETGCAVRREAYALLSSAGCFLSVFSLNPHTYEGINIQRSQAICPGSHSQQAQETGYPLWSIYKTCSQSTSRLHLRDGQHSLKVLESGQWLLWGKKRGVLMERGHTGASSLLLELGCSHE